MNNGFTLVHRRLRTHAQNLKLLGHNKKPQVARQDGEIEGVTNKCSGLKSSMPFKCDLALQNIPLSKQPFKTQPQIENEDVT